MSRRVRVRMMAPPAARRARPPPPVSPNPQPSLAAAAQLPSAPSAPHPLPKHLVPLRRVGRYALSGAAQRQRYVECPHCHGQVEIAAVNCGIFRHGVWRDSGQQLSPHASREVCKAALASGRLDGCARPFRLRPDGMTEACGYDT